jgi:uncharacterized protein (DUF1330 family)
MAGYILARLEVLDEALFAEYRRQVVPLLAEFGGQTVINSAEATALEGSPPAGRIVCVRFPDVEKAVAFLKCDRYQPLKALRDRAAKSEVQVVQGEA